MWLVAFLVILFYLVSAREVPFTLEDRERLRNIELKVERLEEGQKALNQRIEDTNKRIDDTNKRIDDMMNLMLWGFGVLFAGMMTLIGLVIWDRRTALSPAIRRTEELEEREKKTEKTLKKLAKKDPEVGEILKEVGIL